MYGFTLLKLQPYKSIHINKHSLQLWGVARYFAATYIEYRLNDVFEVFFSELFHSSWLAIRALPFAIKSMFSTAVIAPLDALRTLEAIGMSLNLFMRSTK